ncbi:MAG: structural protein P5 [Prevotellaceae bacterium]|nr:structural protein P5 [Candidatus Minthosoma equi]
MTRGERNNNPLNIRRSKRTKWLGQVKIQRDKSFVQFQCMMLGFRAAFRLIRSYVNVYGLTTIRTIIYRWAPPEDGNDTDAYISTVCFRTGYDAGRVLNFYNEEEITALVRAMAFVESRMTDIDPEMLHKAYMLAR